MAAEPRASFSVKDAVRIAAVVQRVESEPRAVQDDAGVLTTPQQAPVQFVRISSLTTVSGRYPGYWLKYDVNTSTWSDGDPIWCVVPNGETPALATRYEARGYQYVDGRFVFVLQQLIDAGGGTLTVSDYDSAPSTSSVGTLFTDSRTGINCPSYAGGTATLELLPAGDSQNGVIDVAASVQTIRGEKLFRSPNNKQHFQSTSEATTERTILEGTGPSWSLACHKNYLNVLTAQEAGIYCFNDTVVLGNRGVLLVGRDANDVPNSLPVYAVEHAAVIYPGTTSGAFKGGILTGTAPTPSVGGVTGAIGVANSVVMSGSNITLSGDSASPGNSKQYATDGSGVKGWYPQSTGTVTSVALSLPAIFAVSGSPVTTSGTLTGTLATQTANFVWAGPTSGGAADPTFRLLVAADIPSLDAAKITTGQLGVARGGSGADLSATSGYLKQASAGSVFSNVATIPYGDVANITTPVGGTLLGRYSVGNGAMQLVTISTGLSLDGSGNLTATNTGTVTTVSVVTANGVSGSVANATTTPAITLTLGAITPSSVAAVGTVTGSNLSGTNTGDQTITLTGNVTGSGTGSFATTIAAGAVATAMLANGAVTLGKQADMATASVVYRKTAGSGAPEVQTLATLKTDLGLTGTNSGDQTITLTGNVTGSGTGSFATTIAAGVVTNSMLAGSIDLATKMTGVLPIGNVGFVTQQTKTASFTTATTAFTYLIDLAAAAGSITATMGSAATAGAGCEITFLVTTAGSNAKNFGISGIAAWFTLVGDTCTVVSDGTNWKVKSIVRRAPTCAVTNSATTSIVTATITKLTFNTETFDDWDMHSTSVNTGRITITRTGKYLVNGMVSFATNAVGQRRVYIYVNGTAVRIVSTPSSNAVTDQAVTYTQTISLASGDYLEMGCWQNSGGNLNVQTANTFLEATLVDGPLI